MTPILIDSCIYIDHLRRGIDIRQLLAGPIRAAALYNVGVVRAEVLRGMNSPHARDGIREFFDIIPEIPCDARLWQSVSELGWDLGRRGKWPPVTDLAIAAAALRLKATLITVDKHFADIPGLNHQTKIPKANPL